MKVNKNLTLVYLASPYSKYVEGRMAAYMLACDKAAELMNKGYAVFCPIAHSHSIEVSSMEKVMDGDWWLKQDFAILEHCDELHVYQMPGWEDSYGVQQEIDYAEQLGIPIKYIKYEPRTTVKKAA